MSHKKQIHAHYEPRIRPRRAHHEILDWASARSQERRFQVLADNVELSGKTLLDVGCGLGDLYAYLRGRGVNVAYTGVDLVEKMVQAARAAHAAANAPGGGAGPAPRFVHGDLFVERPLGDERFDVVFCSGTFNLNLGNNRQFLPTALDRLLAHARAYMVFNLLHHRQRGDDPRYAYYDPQDVLTLLRRFPVETRLLEDYLPNDFTIICRVLSAGAAAR